MCLPVFVDWTTFYGLQTDGEILVVPTEEDEELKLEDDNRLQRMAIFQGAKKYFELRSLVPQRPDEAVDCNHCEGRGRIDLPGIVGADTIVCYCGGLGWLLPDAVVAQLDR